MWWQYPGRFVYPFTLKCRYNVFLSQYYKYSSSGLKLSCPKVPNLVLFAISSFCSTLSFVMSCLGHVLSFSCLSSRALASLLPPILPVRTVVRGIRDECDFCEKTPWMQATCPRSARARMPRTACSSGPLRTVGSKGDVILESSVSQQLGLWWNYSMLTDGALLIPLNFQGRIVLLIW